MKLPIIKKIDETISAVKLKENEADFGQTTIDQFEFYFILVLEIIRYEIISADSISDKTASAATILFTFQVFEYYFRDYPNLYEKCSDLACQLQEYNINWKNHDLPGIRLTKPAWIKFFRENITKMIQEKGLYNDQFTQNRPKQRRE